MTRAAFFVPGRPVPYNRTIARQRHIPEPNQAWRSAVALEWRRLGGQVRVPEDGEHRHGVELLLIFHGANPMADLDNLAKEVLDALNGLAWHDDRQILDLSLRRLPVHAVYGQGVEVRIHWLPEDDPRWVALQPRKKPRKRCKAAGSAA